MRAVGLTAARILAKGLAFILLRFESILRRGQEPEDHRHMTINRLNSPIVALAFALVTGAWVVASGSIARAEVQWSQSVVVPQISEAPPLTPATDEEDRNPSGPVDLVYAQLAVALAGFLLVGVGAFAIVNRAQLKDAFWMHAERGPQ